ncbi:MAG: YCF48-related protein [Solirubrobacterales bacterium]
MSKKFSIALGASFAIALVAAVAAFAAVTAGNTGWHWGNPLPQGNTLTTVDAVGNRIYAGGETGTLLRSDDAGSTWTAVRTGLLDNLRLARAISADSVVFAGSCALRRTDDGGNTVRRLTWGPSDASCPVKIQSFYFPNGSVGYLLLENGDVFTTSDGGDSWAKKTAVPGTVAAGGGAGAGDIWFTGGNTGVVSAGGQIFQTTDGATSWTPVTAPVSSAWHQFSFVSATDGFAVGEGGKIAKTINGGATWTEPIPGGPTGATGATNGALRSIDCVDALTCMVTNVKGTQLLHTIDGGASWLAVSPTSNGVFGVGLASATRAVAVGGGGATVVSNDSGVSWNAISSGAAGAYDGLRAQSATTAFAYGDNGALARTTDGGNSWQPVGVSTSSRIFDVAFPTATRGFVLDEAGVVLRSNNSGLSWQFLDTGTSSKPRALASPNAGTVVLVGPKGVRRSTDNGDSFGAASGRGLKKAPLSDLDVAGKALFAYGSKRAFVSVNGGGKWLPYKLPRRATISDLDMVSAKAGYLLDSRSELFVTRNAGKKWTRIDTTGADYGFKIAFGDMAHGYMTDDTGRILYTGDAGRTWSRQYPFFDNNGGSYQDIDAPTGGSAFMLVLGTNKLFATTSNGQIGKPSNLTIKASSKKVKRNTVIKVTGKLAPNSGGERVTVLARTIGAKGGTNWASQERTVAANGTFTTSWKVKKPTIFIARWSGDSGHDGDGAKAIVVRLR